MKTFASWYVSIVCLGLVAVSIFSLKDSPDLFVPEIQLVSTSSQSGPVFESIASDLKQKFSVFAGEPIWNVSMIEIHRILQKDSRLESFQIRRKLPNKIQVSVFAKQPLAALFNEADGTAVPLSADGSLLAAMALAEAPDLPLVRGGKLQSDLALRVRLVDVLSVIPQQGQFSRDEISEVVIEKSGEVSVIMSGDATKVLLGKTLAEKQVSRISQVLKYLKSRSIKGRVIDARFSKKVVVRVRNAS
jgi:cell division septal protein FtsQ